GQPFWGQLALVILCMVAARSVAITFNRIVDARIDARNPRTERRPLPAGTLSHAAAYLILCFFTLTFGIACLGFFIFYQNTWPILLSGPVLLVLCGYSFTKRFTQWSHYYLGSALAISPLAAWLAVHPSSVGLPAILLMMVVTFWVAGFDIIYACQDIQVDRRDALYSLPARLGPKVALWLARCSHGLAMIGLIALGVVEELGVVYALGVLVAGILLVVENGLVRPGKYDKVNTAFFVLNGMVSVVLATTMIVDVFLG
ncbi:MAG: 4-hydroxybenzoate octaprenyltransferase, partial [Planctomycetes bacterium]|nr:4-hydroxybenzoate octaprenyltransferase [Planctomycetota bacterium]